MKLYVALRIKIVKDGFSFNNNHVNLAKAILFTISKIP
ncbi:hypothetical protein NU08_3469 [Flavobacterium anhuiense]|uniref:Uncharacterized protein n=1 Tax=Flavobacterium anhuiense TaxID=459526 RepID=A0A444VUZ7_9FLAO|nr:hypothetical protein NU08_3469 [Flavobacterium anhuiense]